MSEGQESTTSPPIAARIPTPSGWPHGRRLARPAPRAAGEGTDAPTRPRRLLSVEDASGLSPEDPLLAAERLMAAMEERCARREPAGDLALRLWRAVARVDGAAVRDAAQRLVVVGLADPTALEVALAAVAVLRAAEPERLLWRAYAARLLAAAAAGPAACVLAREVIAAGAGEPLAWTLAIDALREGGQGAVAVREVRARLDHPALGAAARALQRGWSLPPAMRPRLGPVIRRRP